MGIHAEKRKTNREKKTEAVMSNLGLQPGEEEGTTEPKEEEEPQQQQEGGIRIVEPAGYGSLGGSAGNIWSITRLPDGRYEYKYGGKTWILSEEGHKRIEDWKIRGKIQSEGFGTPETQEIINILSAQRQDVQTALTKEMEGKEIASEERWYEKESERTGIPLETLKQEDIFKAERQGLDIFEAGTDKKEKFNDWILKDAFTKIYELATDEDIQDEAASKLSKITDAFTKVPVIGSITKKAGVGSVLGSSRNDPVKIEALADNFEELKKASVSSLAEVEAGVPGATREALKVVRDMKANIIEFEYEVHTLNNLNAQYAIDKGLVLEEHAENMNDFLEDYERELLLADAVSQRNKINTANVQRYK